MNLKRLEYFTTLAKLGNMGRASEILRISTPALSKAMKVLEEELEVKLWIKDGRRIILSDQGALLLKRTPEIIKSLSQLKESLHLKKSGNEIVRVGTFETFSTYFLSFLDRMSWNDCSLELHEVLPGLTEKYIIQGDLDIGITYLPVPDPQLDFLKVATIEMGVFTRIDAFKGVPQKDLPFVIPIMPIQGIPNRVRGLDGWPDDAYERKVLHQVTLMESALELCRQGRVAGFFPAFIAKEHNKRMKSEFQLERRKSPFPGRLCQCDVFIVKRRSMEESRTIKKLAKAIRLICAA